MRSLQSVLVAAAAAAFGVVTWSLAHVLTHVLFAHAHVGSTRSHIHSGIGPFMVAAAALLVTTAVSLSIRGGARWASPVHRSSLAAACAPAVFLLIEGVEHLAAGDEGTPTTLVVIGVLVHATMGAATPLLWHGLVRHAILRLPVRAHGDLGPELRAQARPADRTWAPARVSSRIWTRGPPVLGI